MSKRIGMIDINFLSRKGAKAPKKILCVFAPLRDDS
jgi:hypothetical protein